MRHWYAVTALLLIASAALAGCSKPLSAGDAASATGAGSTGLLAGRHSTDGTMTGDVAGHASAADRHGTRAAGTAPGGTTYTGGTAGTQTSEGAGRGQHETGGGPADGSTVYGQGGGAGSGGAGSGAAASAANGAGGGDGSATGGGAGGAGSTAVNAAGGAGSAAGNATGAGRAIQMDAGAQAGANGSPDGVVGGAMGQASAGATSGGEGGGQRPPLTGFQSAGELADIHFDYDTYSIRASAATALEANARWLRSNPAHVVLIEGHCDERGTQDYNMALGAHRAKATMTYLVSQGVAAERIRLISYGKERPVCSESTDSCLAKNRRAHFLVKTE